MVLTFFVGIFFGVVGSWAVNRLRAERARKTKIAR